MGLNYKAYNGNSDFRGFLASQAPGLLAYTGNDGGVNTNDWLKSTYGQGKVIGDSGTSLRYLQDQGGQDKLNATKSAASNLYNNWMAAQGSNKTPQTGAFTGGGSGSGGSSQNVLGQYQSAIDTTKSALGRLPTQLEIAQGNINKQYGTNRNELNTAFSNAKNSYGTSSTQNQQNFRGDKNQIADAASAGLRGLQRTLGAYGAGGSSDAMYVAPQAVALQASQEQAGAGQNFAQNQQSLDTNWGNFQNEDENSRKKLDDWKTQQINNVRSQSDTTKQDLLSRLADLVGQRAAYQGGSYEGAARPFIDQSNALSNEIDQLAKINPSYNGETPVYEAPSLGSYVVDPNTTVQASNAVEQSATPFLSLLLGQRDRNNIGA